MTVSQDYRAFLDRKAQLAGDFGFEPSWMPTQLFDFQQMLVEWAGRRGRSAIFADCGLGKTPCQLTWAENIVRQTNKRVLVLTPLAVASQTFREGEKFGIECAVVRGSDWRTTRRIRNGDRVEDSDPNYWRAQ